MNLLIITHDFPYGTAETFLETEIEYAAKTFENIYILSASRSEERTRNLPHNVIPIKATRHYKSLPCMFYAFIMLFSKASIREFKRVQNFEPKVSLRRAIRSCLKSYLIEHRLYLKVKELRLYGDDYIAYSYWFAEGAFFVGKHRALWKKTISRAHSYELWNDKYNPFIVDTSAALSSIYCISENTLKLYYKMLEMMKSKPNPSVYVSRLGINTPSLLPERKKEDVFRIVSCSSIYPLKRLDLIVDALSMIRSKRNIEWIHFGGGVDEEKIKELCDKKLTLSRVGWQITGWVDNSKVLAYYQDHQVNLFINMSDNEGIPVSIMEAISFGIPCMARDVGGNREIVNDKTGYLMEPNVIANEVAEKISEIISNNIVSKHGKEKSSITGYFNKNYAAESNYKLFFESILNGVIQVADVKE